MRGRYNMYKDINVLKYIERKRAIELGVRLSNKENLESDELVEAINLGLIGPFKNIAMNINEEIRE